MKYLFYKGFRGTKREKKDIQPLKKHMLCIVIYLKKVSIGVVRQRSAVGAKIEGILGVNRVVTEEKSQKEKRY